MNLNIIDGTVTDKLEDRLGFDIFIWNHRQMGRRTDLRRRMVI